MVLSENNGLKALFLAYTHELQVFLTRKTGDPDVAADLVQETLIRVAAQPIGAVENTRAYLYRTASNLAVDHFRREERRGARAAGSDQLLEVVDESPEPEEMAAMREQLQILFRALAELPPLTQQIFLLNRMEGFSYAEVAARLQVSDSTVQKHLSRALCCVMQAFRDIPIP